MINWGGAGGMFLQEIFFYLPQDYFWCIFKMGGGEGRGEKEKKREGKGRKKRREEKREKSKQ